MDRKQYVIGFWVLLVLILLVMLPWIDGLIFKRDYFNFITLLNANKRVNIKVLEYHQGYIASDAKISVSPLIHPSPENSFLLEQHISHGPWVKDHRNNRRTFALAFIQNKVHAPSMEALLLTKDTSVAEMNTLVTLNGHYLSQIKTPVFVLPIGNISWQGLTGNMDFYVVGSRIKQITTDLTIGAISAHLGEHSLITQDAHMHYVLQPDVRGLFSGSSDFVIPLVTLNQQNNTFFLKNARLTNAFQVVDTNFYQNHLQFSLEQLSIPDFLINPSTLDISFDNISAEGLLRIIKATHEMPLANYEQYGALVPGLITLATVIKEDVMLNTSYGSLLLNGQINWPFAVNTWNDVMQGAKGTLNIRVSVSLVNQLLKWIPAHSLKDGASAHQDSLVSPEKKLLEQIDTWSTENKLDLSVGLQIKDVIQLNLPPDLFARKIDQFVQLKEIPADIAAQIKNQYALAKKPPVQTAKLPQPPANPMQETWDRWIKQGLIKQDKDNYVTLITYEQGMMKANGLPLALPVSLPPA
ncbi:MAG: hypothetical protein ACD_45C00049G0004 [uncultured bacterium]|nr:MAG: hypothetical protein ACD_45C00049G0004 [uncultured bacterium]